MKTPAQILRDALALLGPNGERWQKGNAEKGECVCAWYAICKSAGVDKEAKPAMLLFRSVVKSDVIAKWNDAPERTWPEVQQAFLKAIELAETTQ